MNLAPQVSLISADDDDVHFVKTHQTHPDGHTAIYLVRDGCDASVSYARYLRQFTTGPMGIPKISRGRLLAPSFGRVLRRVIRGKCDFGSWGDHVSAWTGGSARTVVVRFEDLIRDPIDTARGALVEAGHPAQSSDDAAVPTFEELNRKWPEFFRAGRVGQGRLEMPPALLDLFWQRHGRVDVGRNHQRVALASARCCAAMPL